jgi:hypothetical protein
MSTPQNNKNRLFGTCLLAVVTLASLPAMAWADSFEVYCRELSARPDKNLPSPYKAVWDGSILTQIAADSNGKISQSSERVVASRRLPMPNAKGLKYSFVTGIHKMTKSKFLTNISAEPTSSQDDFVVSVSYATLDSDGFLIYAFEVVNEKCALSIDKTPVTVAPHEPSPGGENVAPVAAPATSTAPESGAAPAGEPAQSMREDSR